jgi:hypothetical protein
MTPKKNVISMVRVRISKDPAVIACGENDVAYDFAIDLFERAVPTTKLGLWLKLRLLRQREEYGDELTDEGWLLDERYRKTLQVRVV